MPESNAIPGTLSVPVLSAAFRDGALSPADFTEHHLARIAQLDPVLHAFHAWTRRAHGRGGGLGSALEGGRAAGTAGRRALTIKDNMDMAGLPTRHGSTTTDPAPAAADSPAVARLRAAGAVILGKTTLPEFGWKGITDSRLHGGATRNPWDTAHSPADRAGARRRRWRRASARWRSATMAAARSASHPASAACTG